MKNLYLKIDKFMKKLIEYKFFLEIYCLILASITFFGWLSNTLTGIGILLLLAVFAIIFLKDLKYIIPNVLFVIFNIHKDFSGGVIPWDLVIFAILFIIVLVIFIFKNGIKMNKMHSFYYLLALAIIEIIPIVLYMGFDVFKNTIPFHTRDDGVVIDLRILYLMFFGNLLYLILYVILSNGIKSNSNKMLAVAFSYLAIILTFELLVGNLESLNHNINSTDPELQAKNTIFDQWFYIGWGLCNEAGIMILFSIPFIAYLILKKEEKYNLIVQYLKLSLSVFGIILTTSRGSYIMLLVELFIIALVITYKSKYRKIYFRLLISIISLLILGFIASLFIDPIRNKIFGVYNKIFDNGLNGNGRLELYDDAMHLVKTNPFTFIFGAGITADIRDTLAAQYSTVNTGMQVFHSTYYETIVIGGFLGVVALLFHIKQKYNNPLYINDDKFYSCLLISYIILDVYGLIDNTYYMYYYMIPLMIVFSVVDFNKTEKNVSPYGIKEVYNV